MEIKNCNEDVIPLRTYSMFSESKPEESRLRWRYSSTLGIFALP
jgi:hypothetical protein